MDKMDINDNKLNNINNKKNIFNNILNVFFPNNFTCIFCGDEIFHNEKHSTCDKCLSKLPYNDKKICLTCGTPISSMADYCIHCKGKKKSFDLARAPFVYKNEIVQVIQGFKFGNKKYLAEPLGYFMAKEYEKSNFGCDVIIPVPVSEKRLKQRGYNQSELLANEISKIIGIPVDSKNLIKTKNTKDQTTLNYLERQENLRDSFKILNKKCLADKCVLLIDDVYTTGSTMKHCCEQLIKAKVKGIFCLSLAHTDLQ